MRTLKNCTSLFGLVGSKWGWNCLFITLFRFLMNRKIYSQIFISVYWGRGWLWTSSERICLWIWMWIRANALSSGLAVCVENKIILHKFDRKTLRLIAEIATFATIMTKTSGIINVRHIQNRHNTQLNDGKLMLAAN